MKQVVEKIQTLYDELVEANKKADAKNVDLSAKLGETDELKSGLTAKKKDLTLREKKVEKVEDVVALELEVKEGEKKLKAERGQSNIESKAFEEYQVIAKKEHQDAMKKLDNLKKSLELKAKKDKATLVSEIMKEIGLKVSKE